MPILDADDARAALRIPEGHQGSDGDIAAAYLGAVDECVENILGRPVQEASRTVVLPAGRTVSVACPLRSVTSVKVDGVDVGYKVSLTTGVITSTGGGFTGDVEVTYKAGLVGATDDPPATVKLAARIILKHLFQADKQISSGQTAPPAGFAIPNRARDLLEPWLTVDGFA